MHQELEHRNLEPATTDLYLFGTIRIPEKIVRIIAFIGAWARAARRQGWSDEDIDAVRAEALSSDYDHVIQTIMEHSE